MTEERDTTEKEVKEAAAEKRPITEKYIEELRAYIEAKSAEPRERPLGRKEAIIKLEGTIKEAYEQGYTVVDVAQWLTEKGLPVSASTLRSYVPSKTQGKKQKEAKSKGKQQPKSATSVAAQKSVKGSSPSTERTENAA